MLSALRFLLILTVVFMGLKQGWAMLTVQPNMLQLFGKWHFSRTGIMITGGVTLISAVLILFPRTFVWGNFLMAASILMITCFHLWDKDLKGVAIELPFLLLNLVIIFLQHPLGKPH
ncbi:DoxX family protein [Chitinophaga rupis]|nr:DoxX family protein [Chitinophaga rupis]